MDAVLPAGITHALGLSENTRPDGGSTVNIYRFRVNFDTETKHVSTAGLDGASFPIHALQGISLITFELDNLSGAEFSGTPIQWLQDGKPTDLPPWFLVHLHDPHHFALWDFNSDPATTPHEFVLSVFHGGQFYSTSDPTIINEPPIPT
ncbi:MAG: hypothetical protein HC897_18815 [Thermoanaerobaculia bacterium]|nr:hypothetical protein [Thermoanaerobaculia bacterium]